MNLTHVSKLQRDYLGPVNSNTQSIQQNLRHGSRQKQIAHTQPKPNPQLKIQSLQSAIENLRMENQGMNAMIRTKNQQILNLKTQIKTEGPAVGPSETKSTREIYYLNNLRPAQESTGGQISTQLDQAYYQIKVLTKQRDDLKKYIEQLEQQPKINSPIISNIIEAHKNPTQVQAESISQQQLQAQAQQHARVIAQYEEHIASMASKLSTVHKLESEVAQLNQERNSILADFQGMRNELINRIGYSEHLENQLRRLDFQLQQRGPPGNINPADFQNLINQNAFLQSEIGKLNKIVAEKDEKIASIQIGKSGYVQVTKEAFQSMQNNISSLQEKLNQNTESQRKQTQKATNLQVEANRLNRQLTQKSRKAESQFERAQKLQAEKSELSQSLTKTKAELKKMERKYEDKVYDFDTIKAENQKNKKLVAGSQQCAAQIQKYKQKAKESEQILKKLVEQITKIESQYRKNLKQNQKAKEMMQECKSKWQYYDKALTKQRETIQNLNSTCSLRIDQIDKNIERNLNLQSKLRELGRQNDLTDELEQYIKENHYVSAKEVDY